MAQVTDLFKFIRDVRAEADRITWPSWVATRQMTIMVFILVTIVSVYLLVVDMAIGGILKAVLGF